MCARLASRPLPAQPFCSQCGKRSPTGGYGDPGTEYEDAWFCTKCWQSWVADAEDEPPPLQQAFGNRQAFHWNGSGPTGGRAPAASAAAGGGAGGGSSGGLAGSAPARRGPRPAQTSPPADPHDEVALLGAARQAFEVMVPKVPVREEPDLAARKIGSKSRGGNVWGCEITMDGWLRLHGEKGWILTDMRGLEGGIGEVLRPRDPEGWRPLLAVQGFHSQGLCCCEVLFSQVAVRRAPSRFAETLATRCEAELVFVRSQSFDGWLRLAGEPGWMLTEAEDFGQLLAPHYSMAQLDLWLLCDAWRSARLAAPDQELQSDRLVLLKDAQASAGLEAAQRFQQLEYDEEIERWRVPAAGAAGAAGAAALGLTEEELCGSQSQILRCLFASSLKRALLEEPKLKEAVPQLFLGERPALLPAEAREEEEVPPEEGPLGPTMLFEHKGTVYVAAAGGLLFEPESNRLVGIFNAQTQEIEDAPAGFDPTGGITTFEHEGRECVMTGDGTLWDVKTRRKVGILNPDTRTVEPVPEDEAAGGVRLRMAWEEPEPGQGQRKKGPEAADAEALNIPDCLAKAEDYLKRKLYRLATREYGKALEACATAECMDLDEEIAILKKRAACFQYIREYGKLLEDAERVLSFDAGDAEALEWRRLAEEDAERRRAVRR